ncbi:isoprenylcysteine carboxylmethyltransferase family protein [Photobacterium sagamiensis]|uniref:methyltransferase family protein n=1 Tax=Photobacterium sagamiensis TaxID=2910241 RepID=UPI003D0E72FD
MELVLFAVIRITLFILLSILLVVLSWRALHNPKCHGFYRFFAFEGILVLVLMNASFWLKDPLSPLQLISWTILFFSILFVFQGVYLLRKMGGSRDKEIISENLTFENTAQLVTHGIYKYIRHPMYSSLLLLAWGAFLKHITIYGLLAALITTIFLVITAKIEERENMLFFGSSYKEYMKKTKMFIPYIF